MPGPRFHHVLMPALALMMLGSGGSVQAQTKLLRFPDLHGDNVVFTYAGDLWTASAEGGLARRLTAHPGLELFAKFSADGSQIAFTGQYDGDEQVYVIPATGGEPKRLTDYPARGPLPPRWGYDNQVYGWTPDGKSVIFRSMRDGWSLTDTRLYTVPVDGGMPEPLPMPVSGGGDVSPDGKKAVYSPLTRDFRTWKRYEGGWAQDLYIFDLATSELTPVAHSNRTERDPMWIGDAIYFASDRTGTLNLYRFKIANGEVEPLTDSKDWDVRWPSKAEDGRIVFERAGELSILKTEDGSVENLKIEVPDDGLASRPSRIEVSDLIEDYELSPKGERALFVARGDVFTAPIEKGVTRNLSRSSNAHEKAARWSPDGRHIAFISDASGEEELYVVAQDASDEPTQLTEGSKGPRLHPVWSPDSSRIAFSDKDGKIVVVSIEDKSITEVAEEKSGQVTDYRWSPDGRYLAFSLSADNGYQVVQIWDSEDKKVHAVTSDFYNSYNPAWDPDGKFLYFLSERDYAPQLSRIEWNFAGNRNVGIFVVALQKDSKNPFPPESDEVTIEEKKPREDEKAGEDEKESKGDKQDDKADKEKEEEIKVVIDFDGLSDRVTRVPVPADNYGGLSATKGHLIMIRTGASYYGRDNGESPDLLIFAIEDRELDTLAEGIEGYALSADGSKILVGQDGGYSLMDVKPKGGADKKTVSTSGLKVDRIPAEEWTQIFDEVWRRYRDYFYVPNMHGYDWEKLREQYRPLLEHVKHRSDLTYVLGEMIAELNVGHAYVDGGDFEVPDRPNIALPGARFELDREAGRYRIAKIMKGENEEPTYRAPLTEVGVDVEPGDYVLAIDGIELTAEINPYRLLRDKANQPVTLTVNDEPNREDAREVTFRPISSEADLIYLEWVRANRERVAKATNGRVGYIHIPDMSDDGIREFIKTFYPQIRKQGLIVDVRNNGGGNISSMLLERLDSKLLGTRFSRTDDRPGTYPQTVFHGHMVCLVNENSASDGDIFPARFQKAGLGPLIGKRTWGGVIGITSRGPLIDGGSVFVPEFGTNDVDGSWIIEGHGVDPDIVVENDPRSILEGKDPQLERGIEEVLKALEAEPKELPERPEDPIRTP